MTPDAARESARRPDGRFGVQHRSEPAVYSLACPPDESDFDEALASSTRQAFGWEPENLDCMYFGPWGEAMFSERTWLSFSDIEDGYLDSDHADALQAIDTQYGSQQWRQRLDILLSGDRPVVVLDGDWAYSDEYVDCIERQVRNGDAGSLSDDDVRRALATRRDPEEVARLMEAFDGVLPVKDAQDLAVAMFARFKEVSRSEVDYLYSADWYEG